jgi:hypothetical protein
MVGNGDSEVKKLPSVSQLPVRTKPQAPRTLDCAIYWGHGPYKIVSSSLHEKVLINYQMAAIENHKAHRIRGKRLRLPSYLLIESDPQ